MPARVYECDQSEVKQLKKMLAYDPYLDTNLIPKSKEEGDQSKMSPEEKKAVQEAEAKSQEALRKLREDKYLNVIFTRQEYDLREGKAIGIEDEKSYLYLKAPDDFLPRAEDRFAHEFKTVKRASPEIEKKFLQIKEEEETKANAGFGAIFGD